jgi:activator of HSP90 ATPase
MSKTIMQDVVFKNTTPKALYELCMDGEKHSIATGAPAKISEKEGSEYSAHSGYITGKNLQLVKNKLIVQSWRAQSWSPDDIDSTFIIYLEPQGADTLLHAIHANLRMVQRIALIQVGIKCTGNPGDHILREHQLQKHQCKI